MRWHRNESWTAICNQSVYPCGWSELQVGWSRAAVMCDECSIWYHKTSISMTSAEYNGIENVSWRCVKCTTTNCSYFLYQGFNVNVTNSYGVLAGIPGDDSVFYQMLRLPISPFDPPVHSSPHSLARSSGPYHLASHAPLVSLPPMFQPTPTTLEIHRLTSG